MQQQHHTQSQAPPKCSQASFNTLQPRDNLSYSAEEDLEPCDANTDWPFPLRPQTNANRAPSPSSISISPLQFQPTVALMALPCLQDEDDTPYARAPSPSFHSVSPSSSRAEALQEAHIRHTTWGTQPFLPPQLPFDLASTWESIDLHSTLSPPAAPYANQRRGAESFLFGHAEEDPNQPDQPNVP
ncbi:hypothetical protein LZ32DRAFT_619747 [Colletotrichum eremochloae]|nr:hypothetical protein LZ32DRAFT_619747 [Colletotrichum eremochloae]